jgi:hypothetical protein
VKLERGDAKDQEGRAGDVVGNANGLRILSLVYYTCERKTLSGRGAVRNGLRLDFYSGESKGAR